MVSQPAGSSMFESAPAARRHAALALSMLLALSGCTWFDEPPERARGPQSADSAQVDGAQANAVPGDVALQEADFSASAGPSAASEADAPPVAGASVAAPGAVELRVLLVRVPVEQRAAMRSVWNHIREEVVSGELSMRLHENGFRVGIGHEKWWPQIKAAIDEIEGHRATQFDPVRLPPGYPLALELDSEPHDQTLFHVAADGVISGGTWAQSRNVLRISHSSDFRGPGRLLVKIMPEVRQRLEGWRWLRTESGLWQTPNYNGQAFEVVGVSLPLEPDEFILIAPGERAGKFGLIGGAFLRGELDGKSLESYLFLTLGAADAGTTGQLGK